MKLTFAISIFIIAAAVTTGIEASSESKTTASQTSQPKAQKSSERTCSYCGIKKDKRAFKYCNGCSNVPYCGQECQTPHWPTHQLTCKKKTITPTSQQENKSQSNASSQSTDALREEFIAAVKHKGLTFTSTHVSPRFPHVQIAWDKNSNRVFVRRRENAHTPWSDIKTSPSFKANVERVGFDLFDPEKSGKKLIVGLMNGKHMFLTDDKYISPLESL